MKRLLTVFIAFICFMAACGGSSPANNIGNVNTNANASRSPLTTKPPEAETFNNAPTLGPVVQQYYEALRTKNDAMLKDTLTADFLKDIEQDMKDAKRKDLAAFMAEDEYYRPGQVIEVRNEKIEGNKGVADLRGGVNKNWTPFSFALENGKWRFTGGSPEIDNVPRSNINSSH